MGKKTKYRIKLRITPLALAAILAVSLVACKTITATETTGAAGTDTLSEKSSSSGEEEVQVIELAAQQASDELPTDEIVREDELPTDEAPEGNIAWPLEMYETDSEAPEPAKTYSGVTEGETLNAVITYYDICYACCGKTDGVTASGVAVHNGMENPYIVSLNWLPLGSVVEIDGTQYTVADRGGESLNTVGRADIFVPEGHQKALALGRTETTITIIKIAEE